MSDLFAKRQQDETARRVAEARDYHDDPELVAQYARKESADTVAAPRAAEKKDDSIPFSLEWRKFIIELGNRMKKAESRLVAAEERLPTKDLIDYTKLTRKQVEIIKALFHLGEFSIAQGTMLGYTGRAFGCHVRRFVELGIVQKVGKGTYRFKAYKIPKADLQPAQREPRNDTHTQATSAKKAHI